jgi:hypothetical protein
MATSDFVPGPDAEYLAFVQNMSTLVTASPTSYGLLAADAVALAALVGVFATLMTTVSSTLTKTPRATIDKNTARAQLTAEIRMLARRVQSTPSVTAGQKLSLGITVPDHTRSPAAVPTTRPLLTVIGLTSRNLKFRMVDESTPLKRAKLPGIDSAEVYSFVGTTPPLELSGWVYRGVFRKSEFNLAFDGTQIGQLAHVKAVWKNTRGESGPVSDEITGTIAA